MNLTDDAFLGLPVGEQVLPVFQDTPKLHFSPETPTISYKKAACGLDDFIRRTKQGAISRL